jgi:tetratricopeptide (TPR) repeat protein
VRALFAQGHALYQCGRFAEAEQVLLHLLNLQDDFDALHLVGVIAARTRRAQRAVSFISRAIEKNGKIAAAHRHLANALIDLDRSEDALANLDKAIALQPDFVEAYLGRGALLLKLERYEEAVAAYDRAIELQPGSARAHLGRAVALRALQQAAPAMASCDRAIALDPDRAEAHILRGAALRDLKRPGAALASFDRALALRADDAGAHNSRAAVLIDMQRPGEALLSLNRALALRADYALALSNRGAALRELQRPWEALDSLDRAIALNPDLADAHCHRGTVLADLGRHQEALDSYDRAIALRPDFAVPYFNAGICALRIGRFDRGWALYERRMRPGGPVALRVWPQPLWSGSEDLSGKTLFTYSEQGLGDTIQFSRYAKLAEAQGARVILSVQDRLKSLFQGFSSSIKIIGASELPPGFDLHCPLLSLPAAFGTTFETIPVTGPYLFAEKSRVRRWHQRFGGGGFRIGICWQGNAANSLDVGRSIPLHMFHRLSKIAGVRLISLQVGPGSEQLQTVPADMQVELPGDDFDAGSDAFVDTAAVMELLDLVITSDTSIAHLAGALGRPTWVALKKVPDWRWFIERDDSPWYPQHRLFRQTVSGSWAEVFAAMHGELIGRLDLDSKAHQR